MTHFLRTMFGLTKVENLVQLSNMRIEKDIEMYPFENENDKILVGNTNIDVVASMKMEIDEYQSMLEELDNEIHLLSIDASVLAKRKIEIQVKLHLLKENYDMYNDISTRFNFSMQKDL